MKVINIFIYSGNDLCQGGVLSPLGGEEQFVKGEEGRQDILGLLGGNIARMEEHLRRVEGVVLAEEDSECFVDILGEESFT